MITTQEEQAHEIDRLKSGGQVQQVPPEAQRDPKGVVSGRIDNFGCKHFEDGDTGKQIDPYAAAEMWCPTIITACPCGHTRFAPTIRVVGEFDQKLMQRPTINNLNGDILRHPYRYVIDPETGENTIPPELRYENADHDHHRACKEATRMAGYDQYSAAKIGQLARVTPQPPLFDEAAARAEAESVIPA